MTAKEELIEVRKKIDTVDKDLVGLFHERMSLSDEIARVKALGNIAITDQGREDKVIAAAVSAVPEADRAETTMLMKTLIALSKMRQTEKLGLTSAIDFPASATAKTSDIRVAFQGIPGAWSEHAAEQLYPGGNTSGYDYFEDVFEAVKAGKADYGVLPIENSHTGAIGEVYDLLRRHACYIVGQIWISIAQCLLAVEGAELRDLREIFSHPEGFGQCSRFLKNKNWELTPSRNTAYAAKSVADQNNKKFAAIGSRRAARLNGLNVLAPNITNDQNNKTRFIAIAAVPEYDSTSDTISITFSTAHKAGALCSVLESFMLSGINLSRIESRPVSADKYRFFADLQANFLDQTAKDALGSAATHCDYFEVLGCHKTYTEEQ